MNTPEKSFYSIINTPEKQFYSLINTPDTPDIWAYSNNTEQY